MSNVFKFREGGTIFAKGVTDPDVLSLLESVRQIAELHGLHMVLVHDNGQARVAQAGKTNYSAIGAAVNLQRRLLDSIDGD